MSIDFTNTNLLWTSILTETLYRLGLTTAVICPGSRSAPLAIAFAKHPHIEAIPVLDERSASFFALGVARRQHRPVVLVCTSGTAGANFYPAVIEAHESRVPLLVITADRPPELRECNAGQAIDQHKLYGIFPNWQIEVGLPSLEAFRLAYLRQTIIHAWNRALYPCAGPVHLNVPLREPLAPIAEPQAQAQALTFDATHFFQAVSTSATFSSVPSLAPTSTHLHALPLTEWQAFSQGVIIAGPGQPPCAKDYCYAIAQLSTKLGFPVLAEGLSPLRNYKDVVPNLITTYDLILRNTNLARDLAPNVVLRVGDMPTSKQLRNWLQAKQPRQWIIDPSGRNLDPVHGQTTHLPISVERLVDNLTGAPAAPSSYLATWNTLEQQTRQRLDQAMQQISEPFEGKIAWLLSHVLPPDTPIFISNSTPVRDVEFFWQPNHSRIQPYFNRGANGIEGSLSTALGISHRQAPAVMLTGDLALLHDTNGFLLRHHVVGHLTILLINNNGGGIFEMLPIAQFDSVFETFFATPQAVNFAHLCRTYEVDYELITHWDQLSERLKNLPNSGIRVLEIRTNRKADAQWRQNNLGTFAANLTI